MSVQHVEFRVEVQKERVVTLTAPRIHDAPTTAFELDPGSPQWAECRSRLRAQQTSEQFFQTLGTTLFDAIFPRQHRISYELNYQYVREDLENRILQVQMRLLDDELSELPWECMYNPVAKLWLAANPVTPLSRYVDAQVPPPLRLQPPLKLLVVTAEPTTLPAVGAKTEIEAVRKVLSPLLRDGLVTAKLLNHATRRSFSRVIQDFHPHLFHFVGHGQRMGNTCGLLLESEDGSAELLEVNILCELLQQSGQMRVAVLNACETSGAAFALAKEGIAAVGMQEKIRTEAAIPFCRSFYEALASSVPLDLAANRARFSIRLECGGDRRDWCLPAIFLPAGRTDLLQIDQRAQAIRVTSRPPGASITVDRKPTGKVTPDTIVIKDTGEHEIAVSLEGYTPPAPQRVAAEGGGPVELDFELGTMPGFLVVSADRRGAGITAHRYGSSRSIQIGQIGKLGRVGPVRMEPGRYRVTAAWPARAGGSALTAEDEVLVTEGTTCSVQLAYPTLIPLKPASLLQRFAGFPATRVAAVALVVLLVALLAYVVVRGLSETTSVQQA
ncbi:MAG TPA: CHAT domain-containing protein, partial [Phycisphaerae bacterium]|nr:CHAT domain-containing protein [Phycisphaerae bacterium]